MDMNLYQALYNVRLQLKESEKRITGKTPVVCSDDALYCIADMKPRRLSDLEGVPGIGKNFIDKYGQYFINIINELTEEPSEKTFNMSDVAIATLRELEKKLVSINRRNRLLYMPKMASKYAYDMLYEAKVIPLDIIFGKSKGITLCDLSNPDEVELKKYKSLVSLIREVTKDLRDRGQNELYIGYPFVIGRIPGENFDIRCPLVLFPVSIEKTATKIIVEIDDSRDILYNNTLILAYFKFNNIFRPLPDAVIDDIDINTFLNKLISFYAENEIKIQVQKNELSRFKEYSSSEFPKFNPGELYLEHNIILGKFPVCSNSIQKDFDSMLEMGRIGDLLNELLLEVNDLSYESDSFYGDKEVKDDNKVFSISEKNLVYINDLDSSQENVLSAINRLDKLVIQGPPGTGKSQVITSLIAEFVNNDKTVLMVSEKKTALDVVYSRLGTLSQYALLIDDTGNKDLFYKQLERMMQINPYGYNQSEDITTVAQNIDSKVKQLEFVAEQLYRIGDFGIEPYKLYVQSKKLNFNDPEEGNIITKIHDLMGSIEGLKYSEITEIHDRLSNRELLEQINMFYRISTKYPWLKSSKEAMDQYEIINLFSQYNQYKNEYDVYQGKGFFGKLFSKKKLIKAARTFTNKYFDSEIESIVGILLNNPELIREGFNQYIAYDELYSLYTSFNSSEINYIGILMTIESFYGSLTEANDGLYNAILNEKIVAFENNNREVLATINQYRAVIEELSKLISLKKRITRKHIEEILIQSMGNITNAKRKGEIQRIVEGKRKWSVNRFIQKYNFELFKGIKIWLLTPEVVSEILPLETGLFDLVIFDEASQMYVEKGLPSIHRAKKVIVAGDHKQLRPSNLGSGRVGIDEEDLPEDVDISAALEEESLLDVARFKYQDVMLNFHYRSKYEELIAFSNYAFYKGRLYISPNAEKPSKPPIEFHKMIDAVWANRSNYVEAAFIVAMLKDILRERKNEETIGIITFNSNQRDLIMDIIDDQCALDVEFATQIRAEMGRVNDGEDVGLFIKNIESVQGDERDIIIFSIGYAKNENGRLIRNFGWLNQKGGENRLNVAISRAKCKVHVVASFDPEELQVEDTKNEGPRILKKYLQYAKAVSMGDKEGAQQILHSFGDEANPGENISFDSDFEIQVYDALNERLNSEGYTVDTQVGIGGYSIDLAIKKNGKYILGIECDGRMYHSSKSARERDYHRQKYLESRGWRIHRIWSTDWWKNPRREIEKIASIAGTL